MQMVIDSSSQMFSAFFLALQGDCQKAYCRQLVVVSGQQLWCHNIANTMLAACNYQHNLWISDDDSEIDHAVSFKKAVQLIGTETDCVIFDGFSGFDPDAFGAISGTIRAGGLLMLLMPDLDKWPGFKDPQHQRIAVYPWQTDDITGRFLQRLARLVTSEKQNVILRQNANLPLLPESLSETVRPELPDDNDCLTQDQKLAVNAILKMSNGRARRPLVLTADRGRGKSFAFGIAAARLMSQGNKKILVTAPRREAVSAVFNAITHVLPEARVVSGNIKFQDSCCHFLPIDELMRSRVDCDLLLIDEAAAIPAHCLEHLLLGYGRIAFATTVHGYEGTGRGFAIRFLSVLNRQTPDWRHIQMKQPIRWVENDPLEDAVFRMLLLNADLAPLSESTDFDSDSIQCLQLDRDELIDNEALLKEVFALLVQAHYRTRPFDLRNLLDGPNLRIYILRTPENLLATVIVAEEGDLDESLLSEVFSGNRRVHGHLLPQSLASDVEPQILAGQRFYRIMRIAVRPECQNKGLGSQILKMLFNTLDAQQQTDDDATASDWIGASFGMSVNLLRFWKKSGFNAVHVGLSRQAASGEHSVIMVNAMSALAKKQNQVMQIRFILTLHSLLPGILKNLEPEIVIELLSGSPSTKIDLDSLEIAMLNTFAKERRSFENSIRILQKVTGHLLMNEQCHNVLDRQSQEVLVLKVLQYHDWSFIAEKTNLSGKSEIIDNLRHSIDACIPLIDC